MTPLFLTPLFDGAPDSVLRTSGRIWYNIMSGSEAFCAMRRLPDFEFRKEYIYHLRKGVHHAAVSGTRENGRREISYQKGIPYFFGRFD